MLNFPLIIHVAGAVRGTNPLSIKQQSLGCNNERRTQHFGLHTKVFDAINRVGLKSYVLHN